MNLRFSRTPIIRPIHAEMETSYIVYHLRRIELSTSNRTTKSEFQVSTTQFRMAQIFRFWWAQPAGSSTNTILIIIKEYIPQI